MLGYPEGPDARTQVVRRHRRGGLFKIGFLAALVVAVLALMTLLYSILNSTMGLAAVQNEQEPADLVRSVGIVSNVDLSELPAEDYLTILERNLSRNVGRRLEREQRFAADRLLFEDPEVFAGLCASEEPAPACSSDQRSRTDLYNLVLERVVEIDVVETWSLIRSIFDRAGIEAELAESEYADAELMFRNWLTPSFITGQQTSSPETTGIRFAIVGSAWVVVITLLFSFPVGVGAAIYLEEYARDNRLTRIIQTNINNLAGVPSIIYGMLGLAVFVRAFEAITSGSAFGIGASDTANGRTILAAGLTLGLLILPIIIINAQEAIKAVPNSLRRASLGLGATQWQTIRAHVLPAALPGILTGTILAMARALGETAPLIVIGASTFLSQQPDGPFSKFTVLPIQIFQWTSRPQDDFRNIAAAAILVLLVLLLALNATAIVLRNRYSRKA